MSYDGEVLDACGVIEIDLTTAYVVAVSGSAPNVCGHLLIFAGNKGGYYFHVAELHGYPKYMDQAGFQKYLKDNGKKELKRIRVVLPDPQGAVAYLEELLASKWLWGVLPNNCVAFVEEVIKAGGGNWSSASNCPSLATADTVEDRATKFMQGLTNEIMRSMGVPSF